MTIIVKLDIIFLTTSKLYFESTKLNITELHNSFGEILPENGFHTISYTSFSEYYYKNFNICFSKPKTDIRDYCFESSCNGTGRLSPEELILYNKHLEDVDKHKFKKKSLLKENIISVH